MTEKLIVPDDIDDDWCPPGYEPGPDDPGPVDTECHTEVLDWDDDDA